MKKISIIIILFGILIGIVSYQQYRLKKFRRENQTLNTNIITLTEGIRLYQTQDSLHAASTGILELKLSEYRKLRQQDVKLIESLNIRLKRAEQVSVHTTESSQRMIMPVQDTLIIIEKQIDTAQSFSKRSPYIDLKGRFRKDSVEIALTTYDTLLQVIHRVPRRFLFIRYGTKAIRQDVVSKNPYTKITYTDYIQLRKQKSR